MKTTHPIQSRVVLPALALALALVFAAAPTPAFACTPPPGGLPEFTVEEYVQQAPIVLEGTVTGLTGDFPLVADVQVAQYFKGSGPEQIAIDGFGPSSMCLSEVFVGDHLIFFVEGDASEGFEAFYLSQFDAVALADSQMIAEVIAAAGQTSVTPTPVTPAVLTPIAPSVPTPAAPAGTPNLLNSVLLLGLGLVIGSVIGLVVGIVFGMVLGRRRR